MSATASSPKGKEKATPSPPVESSTVSGSKSLIKFAVLFMVCLTAFGSRLFAVIRFESIIHEFDPWFNYRATYTLVTDGFYEFLNWFDELAWYPLGRIVGGTVYPGLMVTSGFIHYVLNALTIPVHIRDVCVFLAPLFSGLTALSMYLFTSEIWDDSAGLFAAAFMGIVPGYISRSVAGSYDNEGIAIFALMFTYFLWIRSMKRGSVFWAGLCALSYFYMVAAWGGYVFIINLIPLHVLVLLVMGKCTSRVYVAYCTFFILGLILSMQVPFVGFLPLKTSEHMASIGVFGLLQVHAFVSFMRPHFSAEDFRRMSYAVLGVALALCIPALMVLTYLGYVAPFSGRFYSLWDTGYAKIHIPIIASVSEHQPTMWTSFFMDQQILAAFFPAGLWFVIQRLNDERIFIVLYAISAVYFAGVMVRLILTLTPIVVVCASIAFSHILKSHLTADVQSETNDKDKEREKKTEESSSESKKSNQTPPPPGGSGLFVVALLSVLLILFVAHCTWVTSNAYSSPSVVLSSYGANGERNILDDFREAYYWLRKNTPEKARVMSWWDYGYQIAGFSNRTVLVDNNTWNNSHIAMVGMAMSSNESRAYEIMRSLDVDYVLVIFGGYIGYSGDDINKFLWMVRIAEGEHPDEIRETEYFTAQGEYRVDAAAPERFTHCLMYKLSYYRFWEVQMGWNSPGGYDRTRNVEIGYKNFDLKYVEEAFTSEHWLVRIYKVKDLANIDLSDKSEKSISKSAKKSKKDGLVKNKQIVVKPTGDSRFKTKASSE